MIQSKRKEPKLFKSLEPISSFEMKDRDTITNSLLKNMNIDSCTLTDDVEFQGCLLRHIVFDNIPYDVSFTNCILEEVNCSNLNLDYKSIHCCNFSNVKLTGFNVEDSLLSDILFLDCDFTLANFVNTHFKNVIFQNCLLKDVRMFTSKLEHVTFINCRIEHLDNIHTPLKGVDLSDSYLIGGTFYPEDLKGAIVNREQAIILAQLLGVKIKE